jgi:hypothetical protein
MGIISPKKPTIASKAFLTVLVITFSPILIMAIFLYLLWGAILYFAIWLTWKEQRVLFVYSNSPTWKEYIEREILPPLQNQAIILNWSERKTWKTSLPVLAFQYFGKDRNFNPMAIVFRPFHLVKTYRFYEAFKDFKHGKTRKVQEIKRALFETLGVESS